MPADILPDVLRLFDIDEADLERLMDDTPCYFTERHILATVCPPCAVLHFVDLSAARWKGPATSNDERLFLHCETYAFVLQDDLETPNHPIASRILKRLQTWWRTTKYAALY